jgi:coenzyme Q-binding protein COQ10
MPSHTEQRHLRYTPSQLFDLVADVEKYPEFLPGLMAVRVLRRQDNVMWIDMVIGLPVFHGHFTSKAVLDPPNRIDITSDSGLFEEFRQNWTFREAENGGTLVEFNTKFAFRSVLLRAAAGLLFGGIEQSMVDTFRRRARLVYGPAPPPENPRTGKRKAG